MKDKLKNLVDIVRYSEELHEIGLMVIMSIVVWRNSIGIYGDKVTPILILLVLMAYNFLKLNIQKDKELTFKCWIASSVITFSEVLGKTLRPYLYKSVHMSFMSLVNILILSLILSIIITPIMFYIIDSIQVNEVEAENEEENKSRKKFITTWIFIGLAIGICWIGFYPGLLAYSVHWEQNIKVNNSLIYEIIIDVCLGLSKLVHRSDFVILFFNILQIALISFSLTYSLDYLKKLKVSKILRILLGMFYIGLPIFPLMSVCSTKQVMIGSINLITLIFIHKSIRENKLEYEIFGVLMLINCLLDINYIYLVLGFGLIIFIKTRKNQDFKKNLVKIECGLLIIVSATLGFNKVAGIDSKILDKIISLPCQQIARTCSYNRVEDLDKLKNIDSVLPLMYSSEYNVLNPEPIRNVLEKEKLKENTFGFIREYIGLGFRYPKEYFEAYTLKNMGIWYSDEKTTYNLGPLDMSYYNPEKNNFIRSLISGFYKWFDFGNVSDNIGVTRRIFYTGTYVWINVICLLGMIWKDRKKYLVLPLIVLGYLLILSFDTYINIDSTFNVLMCTPFILYLTLFGLKDKEVVKENE